MADSVIVCLNHPDRATAPRPCAMVEVDGRPADENICVCCEYCREICRTKPPKDDWPWIEAAKMAQSPPLE